MVFSTIVWLEPLTYKLVDGIVVGGDNLTVAVVISVVVGEGDGELVDSCRSVVEDIEGAGCIVEGCWRLVECVEVVFRWIVVVGCRVVVCCLVVEGGRIVVLLAVVAGCLVVIGSVVVVEGDESIVGCVDAVDNCFIVVVGDCVEEFIIECFVFFPVVEVACTLTVVLVVVEDEEYCVEISVVVDNGILLISPANMKLEE